MKILRGTQRINNGLSQAIIEYAFTNYVIYVFQGRLSKFDIVIKYKKDGTRMRTPKHIHWVVDILMKIQANEDLTRAYLRSIQACWNACTPLESNDFETLVALIEDGESKIEI